MTEQDKPAFARAMAGLCIALREKEPDAVQMKTYFKAMADLDVELVVAAAESLGATATWFPKAPEWREAAHALEKQRTGEQADRIRKRRVAGLPPLCAECDDTGWRNDGGRYRHCDCLKLRRMEVLGRRPMPALPEAAPVVNNEPRLLEAIKPAVKGF